MLNSLSVCVCSTLWSNNSDTSRRTALIEFEQTTQSLAASYLSLSQSWSVGPGKAAGYLCPGDSVPGDNAFHNDAVHVSMSALHTGSAWAISANVVFSESDSS